LAGFGWECRRGVDVDGLGEQLPCNTVKYKFKKYTSVRGSLAKASLFATICLVGFYFLLSAFSPYFSPGFFPPLSLLMQFA